MPVACGVGAAVLRGVGTGVGARVGAGVGNGVGIDVLDILPVLCSSFIIV